MSQAFWTIGICVGLILVWLAVDNVRYWLKPTDEEQMERDLKRVLEDIRRK